MGMNSLLLALDVLLVYFYIRDQKYGLATLWAISAVLSVVALTLDVLR